MQSQENIRVGVIGVGQLGQHHARIYGSLPDVRLVGVSDLDPRRGEEIGQKYRVESFEDYHELLSRVQAVTVAVPTSLHGEVVNDCLEQGIHVLVEKPIAATLEEGRGMVERARKKNVQLQVGHVERFNPILDLIRPVLKLPRFIQCNRLAPYQVRGTDVDVVLDLMIHDLDIVLSWGLGPITWVEAKGARVLSKSHDFVKACVGFESGCVAEFTASRVSSNRLRNLSLYQDNLYLSADFQTRQGVLFERNSGDDGSKPVREETLDGGGQDALTQELVAFVQSIKTGVDHGVSGDEAMQALTVAHRVLSVLEQQGPTRGAVFLSPHPRATLGIH